MNARKLSTVLSVLVVLVVMLSACAPAATPAPTQAPAMQRQNAGASSGAAPAQPAAPAEAPVAPAAGANTGGLTTAIKNPSNASPYQANRMIIKNGEMSLMVANTDRAIDQVTSAAVDSGGYIV
ncbi:MAG: hypothetical protein U0559_02885, partial [Anaerolineae bacterium]